MQKILISIIDKTGKQRLVRVLRKNLINYVNTKKSKSNKVLWISKKLAAKFFKKKVKRSVPKPKRGTTKDTGSPYLIFEFKMRRLIDPEKLLNKTIKKFESLVKKTLKDKRTKIYNYFGLGVILESENHMKMIGTGRNLKDFVRTPVEKIEKGEFKENRIQRLLTNLKDKLEFPDGSGSRGSPSLFDGSDERVLVVRFTIYFFKFAE